jgi:hypothetical protein
MKMVTVLSILNQKSKDTTDMMQKAVVWTSAYLMEKSN